MLIGKACSQQWSYNAWAIFGFWVQVRLGVGRTKINQIIVMTPPVDRIGPPFSLLKCLARVNPAVVLLALLRPP